MRNQLKFSLAVAVMALAGNAYPSLAQDDGPLFASIRKSGQPKMALGSVPPWQMISPDGKAAGYVPELMGLVLKGMGLPELKGVLVDWNAQIPALQAGQVDFVAPGLAYTEEHCKQVTYSGPDFLALNGLYVARGNPKHITGVTQIAKNPDLKVAISFGGDYTQFASSAGIKSEQLVNVPDIPAGVAAVTGGRADALFGSQVGIVHPEQKGLEFVLDKQLPSLGYGALFRKEDVAFRDAFDKELNVLRGNGVMKDLLMKYWKEAFGDLDGFDIEWGALSKIQRASDVEPSCK
ncbi:polar amino acid transport system substrate-binding protein [Bradyrhizobium sp. CIR18]|uniref:transporter substrate-binding domain-containing protein n=1 Tax=Bradyrhizobium sp. CIR18 TaxID=2663839 RepID=UPI001606526F|nr:transporter substrate-binding domain-containing protein [Bradyrhizobium sp. CIR18]MBB4367140.1 polar amino acid transport system substrate-binding protein [Bradyrhizobium sp. CIR18]